LPFKPPASLTRYLHERRCVLFAGAGLSAWGKLPTWRALLEKMAARLHEEHPSRDYLQKLTSLISQGKLLEVADYCKGWLEKNQYYDVLTNLSKLNDQDIPEPHKIIVNLPFSSIVTTNYDKLLETAYIRSNRGFPRTLTHADTPDLGLLLFRNEFFILKAHGDIDRIDSIVLASEDYRKIIHSNPAFNEAFSALLLTKALLIVGYSISDPDFRLLVERHFTTFSGSVPERYALLSDVSEIEEDVLLRTAGIRVIRYQQHEEVVEFLKALEASLVDYALVGSATPDASTGDE
jgi:SIR2-like domain